MTKDNLPILTVKKFMLKKFPKNEYMDCPVPKHHWEVIQEYAEAYARQFHAIPTEGIEIAIDFAKYVNVRNWRWNDYSEKWEDRERVHNSITNEEIWNKFLLTRNNQ